MTSSGAQQRSVNRRGLLGGRGGFYAAPRDQPRVRRATDIVGLVASLLALAGVVAAQPPGPLERSLLRFLQAFPPWLGPVWGSLIGLLIAWVAVLLACHWSPAGRVSYSKPCSRSRSPACSACVVARVATGDMARRPCGDRALAAAPLPWNPAGHGSGSDLRGQREPDQAARGDGPPRPGAGRCRCAAGRKHDRRRNCGRGARGRRGGSGRTSGARHLQRASRRSPTSRPGSRISASRPSTSR